ncbi:MAG: DUF4249 domain-containing protein [Bacteroidia bacterium]|nr:DUF4249 domain-containing protein [Bacteroidia bacterium]
MKQFAIIIFIVTLVSCEKDITVDLPVYSEKLVVNCAFNNSSPIILDVSHSIDILSGNRNFFVNDANVKLYENGVLLQTVPYVLGKYESTIIAIPGRTYKVVVNRGDYPEATGESTIPLFTGGLQSSYKDSVSTDSSGFPVGEITVRFADDGSTRNYYKIFLQSYDNTTMQFKEMIPVSNDPLLVDGSADNSQGGVIISDLTFNGKTREFKFRTEFGSALGTPKYIITLELISKEYYDYLTDIKNFQPNTGGIISSEPVLVNSNIKNGLGIFTGTYLESDTIR